MNKLFIFLFLISFQLNAQMTNGEVFNYQIGDVHQTQGYGNGGPPVQYRLDTIVNKVLGVDSIIYTINRTILTEGPPPYPTISYSTETLIITQLDSLPIHYAYTSCLPPTDTSFIGTCGENVDYRQSNGAPLPVCFEPPFWYSTFHEGLGGPYYVVYDLSNSLDYTYSLIYSNTSQWGECGTYHASTIGIEENDLNVPKIYPNPTSGSITFEVTLNGPKEVSIVNPLGQIQFQGTINENISTINLIKVNPGIYYIRFDGRTYPIVIE